MAAAALTLPPWRRFHDDIPEPATPFVTPIDQAAQFIAGADRMRMTACRAGHLEDRGRLSLTIRRRARRNCREPFYSFFQN
jgi:hypothetical protein